MALSRAETVCRKPHLSGSLITFGHGFTQFAQKRHAGGECWRGCARFEFRSDRRVSAPKNDLPCLVRYLRFYGEVFRVLPNRLFYGSKSFALVKRKLPKPLCRMPSSA